MTATNAFIGDTDFHRLNKYHLQTGDVITARRGEIGRRAFVTGNEIGWVCGTGCLRLPPAQNIYPIYLSHSLGTTNLRSWLLDNAVCSTMPNSSGRGLAQLPFAIPHYKTQKAIAEYLSISYNKISTETRRKQAYVTLFNSLHYHLMRGKVCVNSYTLDGGAVL